MTPIGQGLILTLLILFFAAGIVSAVRSGVRRRAIGERGYWGRI